MTPQGDYSLGIHKGVNMSPRKKKKLAHQTHSDDEKLGYVPQKVAKTARRGIKKFIAETVDIRNVVEWECDNYEEVYN